jgi:hypothetical protein
VYGQYPSGEDVGYGRDRGYNRIVRINDPKWFTEEAKGDKTIAAFLRAADHGICFSYLQLKSSTSELEWYVHKPHEVLAGTAEGSGIDGSVECYEEGQPIATFVVNHERTLALRPVRAMIVSDGGKAGQMIHKGTDDDS